MAIPLHETLQIVQETISSPVIRTVIAGLSLTALGAFWESWFVNQRDETLQHNHLWGDTNLSQYDKNLFGKSPHGHSWMQENVTTGEILTEGFRPADNPSSDSKIEAKNKEENQGSEGQSSSGFLGGIFGF